MKEIRTIKRSFTQDETLGSLPRDARLLFVGLICIVDDHGRFRAHPSLVRSSVFPYDDDLTASNVSDLLQSLQRANRIFTWEQDGQAYGEIVNWAKHQRVDNAARSDLPERPPAANCGELRRTAAGDGDPALERRGEDRKGTTPLPPTNGAVVHLTKPDPARLTPSECERTFNQFWEAYPRRVGKRAARGAWDRATRFATPEKILASLTAALPELRKKDPQYIPHPTTWLNQGRWEDETTAGPTGAPTARCFTCRKDVAKGGGCTQGEANLEYCDRKDWVTHGQVRRVPHVDSA